MIQYNPQTQLFDGFIEGIRIGSFANYADAENAVMHTLVGGDVWCFICETREHLALVNGQWVCIDCFLDGALIVDH